MAAKTRNTMTAKEQRRQKQRIKTEKRAAKKQRKLAKERQQRQRAAYDDMVTATREMVRIAQGSNSTWW